MALDLLLLYLAGAWEIYPALIISLLLVCLVDLSVTLDSSSAHLRPLGCIICEHNLVKAFLMYFIMFARALIFTVGSFYNESLSSSRDVYIIINVLWYYGVGGTLALQNH